MIEDYDNTRESLAEYVPWTVVSPAIVHVEAPDGTSVTVGLPFVAARSAAAVKSTSIIIASKAVHDTWMAFQAPQIGQKQLQLSNLRKLLYEPPLQRFWCEDCGNEWDAWIAEDGSLEDKWACACTNERCKNHGGPATLLNEEL